MTSLLSRVAPRDAAEATVAAVVARRVRGAVDVTAPLDDLVADDAVVAGVLDEVRTAMGGAPTAGEWRARPTIARLAAVAAAAVRPDSGTLVRLVRTGARVPFHCCHGIGGTVLFFMPVAKLLRPDREFRAFQAHGLDPANDPDLSIEAMSARYVADMRARQARGPYLLGGYSMGGLIAWEMADQLRASGHEVAAVVLLDSPVRPLAASLDELPSPFGLISRALGLRAPVEPPPGSPDERVHSFHRTLTSAGAVPPSFPVARLARMVDIYRVHGQALLEYGPPAADVAVRLLTTKPPGVDALAELGWGDLATGETKVTHVEADHYALMSDRFAPVVARALQPWLDDVA